MEKEKISIIVPIYKVEKYLRKCIQSIVDQTYQNLEIILIEDGSPDGCDAICDQFAKKDSRIKVIHKTNEGLAKVRNDGIALATGQYIGFVDGDDYIAKDMFQKLYETIQKGNNDIAICNFYDVVNKKISTNNPCFHQNTIYNKEEILREILLDSTIKSYAWNKLYRKEVFKDIHYPDGKEYEDIGTTFYILEKANQVIYTDEPYYFYIHRKDGIVNNVKRKTIEDYVYLETKRYQYIKQNYPSLQKYNLYSLIKIILTAYADAYKIKDINLGESDELETWRKEIIMQIPQYEDVIEFFEEDRREELEILVTEKENCKKDLVG